MTGRGLVKGDRVRLIEMPEKGVGTVRRECIHTVYVKWDNGIYGSWNREVLELAEG